jgi:ribosome-binding protein aMBF1 (putative translation factor)
MKRAKRKKLEAAGFRVGWVQDYLHISDEEMALINLKARLVQMLRPAREAAGITQDDLARRICKALFALGVTPQRIGKAIAHSSRAA